MDTFAPLTLAESWDNPGLLIGSPNQEVHRVLVTLDVTADCVDFAIANKYDLIISHHPVIFKKLSSLRTDTYDGFMYEKLLSHGIAVYSAHTNWDSAEGGVNDVLAKKLDLVDVRGLVPVKADALYKFAVYVPESHADAMRQALGDAGAGFIGNYSHCMFSLTGTGQFKPHQGTHPYIGTVGSLEKTPEVRIETIIPSSRLHLVLSAMKMVHPYEEPAYDVYPLKNEGKTYSLGRIGTVKQPEPARMMLRKIKRALGLQILTYAGSEDKVIGKIALCGGAGAEFMKDAKGAGADLYLTGDVKYHEAQEGVKMGLVIADGGHFGTEIPSVFILQERLQNVSREHGWSVSFMVDPTSCDIFNHC